MPIISTTSDPCILVTGANGYIAAWVTRVLLERGYNVRGTVRSAAKGEEILNKFVKLPGYNQPGKLGKFEFVVVEDICKPGAFDEAVKGIDAVQHIASPVILDADDPKDVIEPAVNGTVGILQSVKEFGDKVKRVVVTSSCSSVSQTLPEPKVFSEEDWNEQSIKELEAKGRHAPSMVKYRASKTLAERAAWTFMKENPELLWDLVVLIPPMVLGPAIHCVTQPKDLGASLGYWYQYVMTYEPDAAGQPESVLLAKITGCIDIRDLAEAHARAIEKEEASGQRIIVSAEDMSVQEWLDVANALTPQPYTRHPLAKGKAGAGKDVAPHVVYKNEKAKRVLGLSHEATGRETGHGEWKYRTKEETVKDLLTDFAERGW
uniref:NAD-dependent epimerase/dehydratase domain-containing protein n=1 Tax=Moniliophthora roreri TaxID=221103 RepID=A0A0W0ETB8_MONRR